MLYLLSFFIVFQMFGPPSRIQEKWIGPTPRFDGKAIDIGGVNYWEESDAPFVFALYNPLCKAWLYFSGLE